MAATVLEDPSEKRSRRSMTASLIGDEAVARGGATTAPASCPVLVGRADELRLLTEAVTHPPAVVMIEGEAGVGKSRLVGEVLAQPDVRERTSLIGHAYPLEEPFPMGPVVGALRGAKESLPPAEEMDPVVGALRPLLPELANGLPPPPDPIGDARAERHRIYRAVIELLASTGPTVCVLEDLHWADGATLELLRVLVAELPRRVSVVVTFRREDLSEGSPLSGLVSRLPSGVSGVRVSLEALTPSGVRDMVAALLETDRVSEAFASYLHQHSSGLPLAVEEMLHLLRDQRDIVRMDGRWTRRTIDELRVPTGLRESVIERTMRLPAGVRRLIRAVAVLETPSSEDVSFQVAGLEEESGARALSAAVSRRVLEEPTPGLVGFRHVLTRQAVYESIPSPRRRLLHRRAAQVLEAVRPRPVARLAHHYRNAGLTARWVVCAEAAADLAASVGDDWTASRFMQDVLTSAEVPNRLRTRIALKLGKSALYGLAHHDAVPVLRRALDQGGMSKGARGELRLYLGWLLLQSGAVSDAFEEVQASIPDLARKPGLAARAMATLAMPWVRNGHIEQHLDWLDRAIEAAGRQDDPLVRLAVSIDRAYLLSCIGDRRSSAAAAEIPTEVGSTPERRQLVRGSLNLAEALFHLGYYRRASALVDEGVRASEELRYARNLQGLEAGAALVSWATGVWDGLESEARRLVAAAETPDDPTEALLVLGSLLLARGELGEAEALLSSVVRSLESGLLTPILAVAAGKLARVHLARDEGGSALRAITPALKVIREKGVWVWAAELAPPAIEAFLAAGRHEEAADLLTSFAHGLRGRDAPLARAALLACRGRMAEAEGDEGAASRLFLRAHRAYARLPRPYEAAHAMEAAGRAAADRDDPTGTDLLLGAFQGFEALGASWDASRLRQILRRHGLDVGSRARRGRRPYGDHLSPREAQVARLVAEGKTNRQIAADLFLSPRTVEAHVSRAKSKLGATSRTGLALALQRADLGPQG